MRKYTSIILILVLFSITIIALHIWDNAYLLMIEILLLISLLSYQLLLLKRDNLTLQKRQLHNKKTLGDISTYYVIFLEISNLNTYSQFYNLEMGDVLLKKVHHSLSKHFTKNELFVYSQDQIVIIQKFVHSNIINLDIRYDEQYRKATQIAQLIQGETYTFNDTQTYDLELHIGVASLGMRKQEDTIDEIVRLAHFSMIKGKEQGKDIIVTNEAIRAIKRDLDSFNKEMESGFKLDEFNPYFHPIINLTTLKVTGVEALVRWRKDTYRIIEASKFIDIAKEKQLFTKIDKRVIEKTFQSYKIWKEQKLIDDDFLITVNLSYKTLLSLTPSYLFKLLDEYDISVENIEFDLTERSILSEQGIIQIQKLRKLGFQFSVDTFKDNSFTFQHLLELEIDTIKIDKSKLPHSQISNKENLFYQSIVDFSTSLNCKTLSKGIETKSQLQYAQQLNVDYAQGYYFTKPLDEEQIVIYLNKNRNGILSH